MFSSAVVAQNRCEHHMNTPHQAIATRPTGLFASPTARSPPNQSTRAGNQPRREHFQAVTREQVQAGQPRQPQWASSSLDYTPTSFADTTTSRWLPATTRFGSANEVPRERPVDAGVGKQDSYEATLTETDAQSTTTACTSSMGTYGLTNEMTSDHVALTPTVPHAERVARAVTAGCEAWEAVNRTWYPDYHLAAFANWLSVPGGLCFHNGDYHVFYQHHPFDIEWGPMHWGHAISKDLVHWQHLPVALAPGDAYDRDGCFSGSAVSYKGKLYLFYTGNTWLQGEGDSNMYQVQCLAVSEDGVHFEKKGPIVRPPAKYRHCRDPKVWQREDGVWCMVVGARDIAKDLGQLLMYTSEDIAHWHDTAFMMVTKTDDRNTFMWECPDFFPYEPTRCTPAGAHGMSVARSMSSPLPGGATSTYALLFCPQGTMADKYRNRNRFQAGTLLGRFVVDNTSRPETGAHYSTGATSDRGHSPSSLETFGSRRAGCANAAPVDRTFGGGRDVRFLVTRQFREIDYGHDFYAPQSFVAPDGRRIVLAWMDMWASPMPSREHGWSGCVTIPRELIITEHGDARLTPIRELEALRVAGIEVTPQEIEDDSELPLVEDCTSYELEVTFNVERSTAEKYGLWLGSGAEVYVDAQSERLVVNRHYPEYMLSGNRSCALPDATELHLRVFFDRSSIEVFVNDGEACFSTRIYPSADDRALRLFSINGTAALTQGMVWRLASDVVRH